MIGNSLKELQTEVNSFSNNLVRLQTEYDLIQKEYNNREELIQKYEHDKEVHAKAVELLSLVQGVTRDKIKSGFEDIASWALKYIFQDDYKFCLVFGRRGNLGELDFAIKTPDYDEEVNPMDSRGGGILNVISLILRLILMEVSVPKIKGFIIFDESFLNVNGMDNIERLNDFVDQIQSKFKRQIIHISDMSNFKSNPNYNLIKLGK